MNSKVEVIIILLYNVLHLSSLNYKPDIYLGTYTSVIYIIFGTFTKYKAKLPTNNIIDIIVKDSNFGDNIIFEYIYISLICVYLFLYWEH